ncbi:MULTISPECIES: hypothetical protein [Oceanobacillus]|uniref:hypothetical protein n=1 Tax=Oceanobacillus TaxID=182709 RepID=UPI0030DAD15D
MAGIHIHPHDVLDEGVTQIKDLIGEMTDINYIFPQMNTIFERNPYPIGVLPHNPKHKFVQGKGEMHVILPSYKGEAIDQKRNTGLTSDADPLMILKNEMTDTDIQIIPWANILNGDFTGTAIQDNLVVDDQGIAVEKWLCPNAPDVIDFWEKVFTDTYQRYGYTTYMIDRIRYPDWAGEKVDPRGLLTCFCPHCEKKMSARNLNIDDIKEKLAEIRALLKDKQFNQVVDILTQDQSLKDWHRFRQNSVTTFIANLTQRLKQVDNRFAFLLDLWPPAYSWILGQDYSQLTRYSSSLKHFPYHKLGGGADVQGMIDYFADDSNESENAFKAFNRLFGLYDDLSYSQFKKEGFPIRFVAEQNKLARKKSQPDTHIFSGIQMWNIESEKLVEAVKAADESEADELIYYCYGWADRELFHAIGQYRRGDNS